MTFEIDLGGDKTAEQEALAATDADAACHAIAADVASRYGAAARVAVRRCVRVAGGNSGVLA